MWRPGWKANTSIAALCVAAGTLDVVVHDWWAAPAMACCAGVNSYWARRVYQREHPPAPPARPDYAKIRRLELELGLRDPDLPPKRLPSTLEPPPGTYCACGSLNPRAHVWGCPFDDPGPGAPPMPKPPDYRTPLERGGEAWLSEAQAAAARWEICPVCLRRHEGRCAG